MLKYSLYTSYMSVDIRHIACPLFVFYSPSGYLINCVWLYEMIVKWLYGHLLIFFLLHMCVIYKMFDR